MVCLIDADMETVPPESGVAATKATTRRALLTGLRNGNLEKAVEKMEADEEAAQTTGAIASAGMSSADRVEKAVKDAGVCVRLLLSLPHTLAASLPPACTGTGQLPPLAPRPLTPVTRVRYPPSAAHAARSCCPS